METLRVAADALVEECGSYEARVALHKGDISKWVAKALEAVHPRSAAAKRLVKLVETLSGSDEGRRRLGSAGLVDILVHVWRRNNASLIPTALSALCSGSISNISRFMRKGGVCVASRVVMNTTSNEPTDNDAREALNSSLLLLGLVCVCVPDICTGGVQLIPMIQESISQLQGTALVHALAVVANVAECWRKEGYGFEIPGGDALAGVICDAWLGAKKQRDVANAAAWALTGLLRAEKVTTVPLKLHELLTAVGNDVSAVRALRTVVTEHRPIRKCKKRRIALSCSPVKRVRREVVDKVGDALDEKAVAVVDDKEKLPSPTRVLIDTSLDKPVRRSSRRSSPRLASV